MKIAGALVGLMLLATALIRPPLADEDKVLFPFVGAILILAGVVL